MLVREGLARVTARVPVARLDELKQAEAEAQALRKGMWSAAPPNSRRVILGGHRNRSQEAQEFVAEIPVEYASQRKIRERNKLYYRFNHWPIWIFVFFIAPGPLTFDLFEHGFDSRHGVVAGCGARSAPASRVCAEVCRVSSRSRTSSASPRIGRIRSTGASATRSRGAK